MHMTMEKLLYFSAIVLLVIGETFNLAGLHTESLILFLITGGMYLGLFMHSCLSSAISKCRAEAREAPPTTVISIANAQNSHSCTIIEVEEVEVEETEQEKRLTSFDL